VNWLFCFLQTFSLLDQSFLEFFILVSLFLHFCLSSLAFFCGLVATSRGLPFLESLPLLYSQSSVSHTIPPTPEPRDTPGREARSRPTTTNRRHLVPPKRPTTTLETPAKRNNRSLFFLNHPTLWPGERFPHLVLLELNCVLLFFFIFFAHVWSYRIIHHSIC
jgi:hypothetical protein